MKEWQKNIIIGTVLGGSSLIKVNRGLNFYLSMHSKKSLWLSYKMQELEDYHPHFEPRLEGKTFRCHSICHEDMSEIHELMYQGNERIVSDCVLHPLKDIGLAIWYLDGGGLCGRKNKNIYLNTTKLRAKGTDLILKYFNEMDMHCTKSITTKRIRVIFGVDASEKFARIIEDKVPLFMIDQLRP